MGKDFTFSAATLHLIGDQGESLIKKAAAAVKFKGKALTALDLVAPAGLAAERLIVVGTAPMAAMRSGKAKAKRMCRRSQKITRNLVAS